jgi:hypothetical protein
MARIRTIKPEFWSHPVMTKQTDAVRLLAIALLNYSDDEGYFYAERKLIRSFVWPLDDSSKKSDRSMSELCRIGYVKIFESKEHGSIGKVVNFNEHQRIDRPRASEIKKLIIDECSTNDLRTIDDQSTLERKGKEGNRERKVEAKPSRPTVSFEPPTIPELHTAFLAKGLTDKVALLESNKFWSHFDSNGWKVGGKTKMKSWQSAVSSWYHKMDDFKKQNNQSDQPVEVRDGN